ncbi:PLP-dependent transferase [Enterobacteriaceae endosymbiont of Donacia clavipes]|uniref:PLP-dependent transferase n=1 Tax=Enterobacteriaceae endosymbiont of Donacia clavipes TaxID=2675775 RepID=UPI00144A1BFC|nr:hypothetical protein GJT92_00080 [Enterobacteriaceae endosymbiont of Donacia clavipes]
MIKKILTILKYKLKLFFIKTPSNLLLNVINILSYCNKIKKNNVIIIINNIYT